MVLLKPSMKPLITTRCSPIPPRLHTSIKKVNLIESFVLHMICGVGAMYLPTARA